MLFWWQACCVLFIVPEMVVSPAVVSLRISINHRTVVQEVLCSPAMGTANSRAMELVVSKPSEGSCWPSFSWFPLLTLPHTPVVETGCKIRCHVGKSKGHLHDIGFDGCCVSEDTVDDLAKGADKAISSVWGRCHQSGNWDWWFWTCNLLDSSPLAPLAKYELFWVKPHQCPG